MSTDQSGLYRGPYVVGFSYQFLGSDFSSGAASGTSGTSGVWAPVQILSGTNIGITNGMLYTGKPFTSGTTVVGGISASGSITIPASGMLSGRITITDYYNSGCIFQFVSGAAGSNSGRTFYPQYSGWDSGTGVAASLSTAIISAKSTYSAWAINQVLSGASQWVVSTVSGTSGNRALTMSGCPTVVLSGMSGGADVWNCPIYTSPTTNTGSVYIAVGPNITDVVTPAIPAGASGIPIPTCTNSGLWLAFTKSGDWAYGFYTMGTPHP
jgi:hypothetical protein